MSQGLMVGDWRFHTPNQKSIGIVQAGDKIYQASSYGLYVYNSSDNSVSPYSKINGLTDIGITSINYHLASKTIIVGYSNGNIDFVDDHGVYNFSDIKRAAGILANRSINSISIIDDFAYLCTGFGVVVLDVSKREVRETFYLGNDSEDEITSITMYNAKFFATTERKIFTALSAGVNLSNPANWTAIDSLTTNSTGTYASSFVFNNQLFINHKTNNHNGDTLLRANNALPFEVVPEFLGMDNYGFTVNDDELVVAHTSSINLYNSSLEEVESIFQYANTPAYPLQALKTEKGTYYVADRVNGLIMAQTSWDAEVLMSIGPKSASCFQIHENDGDIWVSAGAVLGQLYSNTYNQDGIFLFKDETWINYNKTNIENIDTLFDFLSVAVSPNDENIAYIASQGRGVVKIKDGAFDKRFTHENSGLQLSESSTESFKWIGCSDLTFDSNNILWVANASSTNILTAKDESGKWFSFNTTHISNQKITTKILATSNNQIWTILSEGTGILIYDYNNTIENSNDDKVKLLTSQSSDGKLPDSHVYAMVEDLTGEIWVGTSKGIGIYRNPFGIFEGNEIADRPLVQQDGYNEHLLESQEVTAIAVDGANRKWIGTRSSGVFLISEDGTEELLHFTAEDSPLINNNITSIAIQSKTGEVFFGTERGICSYKHTATKGSDDFSSISVFPNPVEPNYNGLITVDGLVSDSYVRITDVSGSLVYETTSNGGRITWNGKSSDNRAVSTGVYLVFCASRDGKLNEVSKILIKR